MGGEETRPPPCFPRHPHPRQGNTTEKEKLEQNPPPPPCHLSGEGKSPPMWRRPVAVFLLKTALAVVWGSTSSPLYSLYVRHNLPEHIEHKYLPVTFHTSLLLSLLATHIAVLYVEIYSTYCIHKPSKTLHSWHNIAKYTS